MEIINHMKGDTVFSDLQHGPYQECKKTVWKRQHPLPDVVSDFSLLQCLVGWMPNVSSHKSM